jgi:membrane-bound metal-dependent hydrolase YbcI (DUF457 family)
MPLVLAYTNDILKVGFEAIGLEHGSTYDIKHGIEVLIPADIPWSHGLFMSVVWSILVAVIIYLIYRHRQTAMIMGLVVLSHWFLDFIVHPPELPILFSNSPKVGLGLWSSPQGNIIANTLEVLMMLGGLVIYFLYMRRKRVLLVKKG